MRALFRAALPGAERLRVAPRHARAAHGGRRDHAAHEPARNSAEAARRTDARDLDHHPDSEPWRAAGEPGAPVRLGPGGCGSGSRGRRRRLEDDTVARLAAWDDARVRVVRVDGPPAYRSRATPGSLPLAANGSPFWTMTTLGAHETSHAARGRCNENADFVYAGALAVDDEALCSMSSTCRPRDELAAKLDQACVVPPARSNVIARTESVRRWRLRRALRHLADWDLWIRLVPTHERRGLRRRPRRLPLHDGRTSTSSTIPGTRSTPRPEARREPARTVSNRGRPSRLFALAGRPAEPCRCTRTLPMSTSRAVRYRSPGNLVRAVDALLGKRFSRALRSLSGREPAPQRPSHHRTGSRAYADDATREV